MTKEQSDRLASNCTVEVAREIVRMQRQPMNIMDLPTRDPETGKPQLIDAVLETPGGPVIIGRGFKTLQEASDAVACWSAPQHIEAEAREIHKTSCVGSIRWEQLSKLCRDEFLRDARKKLGIQEPGK